MLAGSVQATMALATGLHDGPGHTIFQNQSQTLLVLDTAVTLRVGRRSSASIRVRGGNWGRLSLSPSRLAEERRLGECKQHELLAGHRADVVVKA